MGKINNNVTDFYCSFEESNLLKQAGFDVPCLAVYYPSGQFSPYSKSRGIKNSHKTNQQWECTAPTREMAIQWIRTNFNMEPFVIPMPSPFCYAQFQNISNMTKFAIWIYSPNSEICSSTPPITKQLYNSPHEAISTFIKFFLENLLKNKTTSNA